MSVPEHVAQRRWLMLVCVRLAGVAGAIFGMILASRAHDWSGKVVGVLIVLSALAVIAVVPASLAHRWRSPPAP